MKLNNTYFNIYISILLVCIAASSCKKLASVPDPINQIPGSVVFSSDPQAEAAVRGIYVTMDGSLYSAFGGSIQIGLGCSADELKNTVSTSIYNPYYINSIPSSDTYDYTIWSTLYATIYKANAVIAGIASSTAITDARKAQLSAEAKFLRAFNYFYLVNIYGDVPLTTTTDYQTNAVLVRTPAAQVYSLIQQDLVYAKANLPAAYVSTPRFRANKYAAAAMLAKVYLYQDDYKDAETQASSVIDSAGLYTLVTNLNNVFLTTSNEVILQLQNINTNLYTWDAYILVSTTTPGYQITNTLYNSFETGDQRKVNWIKTNTVTVGGVATSYNFPYKYKVNTGAGTSFTESLVLLRLSEQYLIRAEARAQQANLSGAIADLDQVRARAITPFTATNQATSQANLLTLIAHERYVELFEELGNRWLDLKRTGQANAVLASKPGWVTIDQLFPIPAADIKTDPYLTQNPGYN